MRRNIEIKARLRSIETARQLALQLTGQPPQIQHQTDTYFVAHHGRLKLREINGSSAQLVWYRRSDQAEVRSSDYLLTPIDDPASLKLSLTSALGVLQVVEKRREISLFQNVRIHLDQVTGLGTFIEFEAVLDPATSDAAGEAQVNDLLQKFSLSQDDLLATSYSDLLA